MVGSVIFNFLNPRLQQIMESKEPFGEITDNCWRSVPVKTCF